MKTFFGIFIGITLLIVPPTVTSLFNKEKSFFDRVKSIANPELKKQMKVRVTNSNLVLTNNTEDAENEIVLVEKIEKEEPKQVTKVSDAQIETESFKNQSSDFDWDYYYEKTIEYIKDHEGINNGKMYIDAAGNKTIGYGHVVKKGEYFEKTISEKDADRLLRADFRTALKAVERYCDLKDNKKLAMAHFIYAKGVGHFSRSSLLKLILAGKPIDDEIVKWCYYTRKGRKIKSKYSLKIRLWELKMYNLFDKDTLQQKQPIDRLQ